MSGRTAMAALCAVAVLAGCASSRPARPLDRLTPDSLRALERAVRLARPGYDHQADALRAGVYRWVEADSTFRQPSPHSGKLPGASPASSIPAAHRFVVQVAAYRDRHSADLARAEAARLLPTLEAAVEEAEGVFRVVVAGWESAAAANADLPRVRAIYPSAWIRPVPLP